MNKNGHKNDLREWARGAFTLVEMLVAVALGVIILAVVVTAFTQGSEVTTVAHAQTEAMHNARVAMNLLEQDLESAYLEPDGYRFDGNASGGQMVLEFLTTSATVGAGNQRVQYSVESRPIGGAGQQVDCLMRKSTQAQLRSGSWSTEANMGQVVLQFSARFYCSGFDDDGDGQIDEDPIGDVDGDGNDDDDSDGTVDEDGVWYENWDSQSSDNVQNRRIPQVVEVTLDVVDTEGVLERPENNSVALTRLITLPDYR